MVAVTRAVKPVHTQFLAQAQWGCESEPREASPLPLFSQQVAHSGTNINSYRHARRLRKHGEALPMPLLIT